jgi:hypothetical protein
MNKETLDKLESEIKHNFEAGIAAIERLRAYESTQRDISFKLAPASRLSRRPIDEVVEEIIKGTKDEFGIWDIFQKIPADRKVHDGRTISQVINRMRQRKPTEIVVVSAGKGSKSGIYKLAK